MTEALVLQGLSCTTRTRIIERRETAAGEFVAGRKRSQSGRDQEASLGGPSDEPIRRSFATPAMPKPYFH
ncbi:MAG TPA: hypothetical protein DD670_08220 [Planctomycetaceae bacterium]|nr:hypothetical protein [Planctomycetaceae bacterium]